MITFKLQDKDQSETSKTDFGKFMKRAGVMGGENLNPEQQRFLNALETLNPNQAIYYQPESNQQSPLGNYVAPKRQLVIPQQQQPIYEERQLSQQQQLQQQQQLSSQQQLQQQQQALQSLQQLTPEQKQLLKQQLFIKLQQLQAQRQQVQQQLQSQQSSPQTNVYYPAENDEAKDSALPGVQDIDSRSVSKADRQGIYDSTGYDQGYSGGLLPVNHGYSDHQDSYSYKEPHKEVVYIPKPSVNIKIDPINILRLLLSGIPRPILNLNGKVFFGVELGKNVGIKKGIGGYAAPAYGGGGKGVVLNLG